MRTPSRNFWLSPAGRGAGFKQEQEGKLLLSDIRTLTGREDCVGIAEKDNDGCWKISQISKEGDLLLHDG